MKARRKPVEVFAFQYRKDTDITELLRLISLNPHEPVRFDPIQKTLHIQKDRGEITLHKGNWIIYEQNTDKCFWFIDNDIFLKTYTKCRGKENTYIKNSHVVDVVLFSSFTPSVFDFCKSALVAINTQEGYIIIKTLEGDEKVYLGEIIVKGVNGEFYPVKPDNFAKCYEILE